MTAPSSPREPAPPPAGEPAPPFQPRPSRFRPVRFHARGGLGEVLVADDLEVGRSVALKRILAPFADEPSDRARFVREAELTGRLEHPGVVPVYGLGVDDRGRPFYAMRFITGEPLRTAIRAFHAAADGPPDGARAVGFRRLLSRFVSVCQTVGFAHSRGVIHRDLKPSNVMLGEYGETLVVDWGLAKAVGGEPSPASDVMSAKPPRGESVRREPRPAGGGQSIHTSADSVMGTPGYMAPEQAEGNHASVGPTSDVYSLGATLYEILTGRPPLDDLPTHAILLRTVTGEVPAPRTLNPSVPAALEAVCRKAMALRPAERYPSAGALAADIEAWLADEPVSAHREGPAARSARWVRRNQTAVSAAGAATAAAAAIAIAAATLLNSARADAERARDAESAARADAESARRTAETARDSAESARAAAEAARRRAAEDFDLADGVIDRLFRDIRASGALYDRPELRPLREKLVDSALGYSRRLLDRDDGGDPDARFMLLAVRLRVAELAEDIDRFAEAEEHFRTVADGLAAQAAVEPGDVLVRGMRLNALLRAARLQSSLGRKLDSAATALALAAEADALHDANASGRPLPPPLPPASSSSPPSASGAPGVPPAKPPSGPRRRRRGVEGPTGPPEWLRPRADLADLEFSPATLRWVSAFARVAAGKAYDDAERPAEAAAALEDGLDRMSRLIEPLEKAGHTESVYAVHRETGDVCAILGRWAEAAEAFARARAVAERLAEHAPPRGSDNYGFRARGPEMLLRSVPPLCRLGRTGEALAAATEAVRLLRQLVASDPGSQHLRRSLATGLMELSTVLAARGEFAGVVAAAAEARPMFEDLIAKGPAVQTNRLAMAGLTCNLGVALCYLGRREESLAAFADLVRQGEGLVRDFPDDRRARRLLAYDGHYNIATVHTHFAAAALKDAALPEAQRRRRADEWCGLAVTALRRAVEAGYRDVGAAEKDPELDILRDRDDFKALMADWRKRLAATPGVR